jgi:hypothetical protein
MTLERLKELLSYDRLTGTFTWRVTKSSRALKGQVAGCLKPHGYREITIDWEVYLAHRLAWFYVNGYWPPEQIDHVNGNRSDNRIVNLREATPQNNMANKESPPRELPRGIDLRPSLRYRARINFRDRNIYIGTFDNLSDAVAAYQSAAQRYFGEFAKEIGT